MHGVHQIGAKIAERERRRGGVAEPVVERKRALPRVRHIQQRDWQQGEARAGSGVAPMRFQAGRGDDRREQHGLIACLRRDGAERRHQEPAARPSGRLGRLHGEPQQQQHHQVYEFETRARPAPEQDGMRQQQQRAGDGGVQREVPPEPDVRQQRRQQRQQRIQDEAVGGRIAE